MSETDPLLEPTLTNRWTQAISWVSCNLHDHGALPYAPRGGIASLRRGRARRQRVRGESRRSRTGHRRRKGRADRASGRGWQGHSSGVSGAAPRCLDGRAPIGLLRQQLADPTQVAGDRQRFPHARGGARGCGIASIRLRSQRAVPPVRHAVPRRAQGPRSRDRDRTAGSHTLAAMTHGSARGSWSHVTDWCHTQSGRMSRCYPPVLIRRGAIPPRRLAGVTHDGVLRD
jgi:hypothetical protein